MDGELGLRERKKQQTRALLAATARELFDARGFDAVTVAEVARAADVSEATVFNYFPTKESLYFSQMESFEASLLQAVRERPAGQAVATAFARCILEGTPRLAQPEVAQAIALAARIIGASPSLQAREREIVDEYTDALAALIADATRARAGDPEPWVAANALMGAHRAIVGYVRVQVQAGRQGPALTRLVRGRVARVFDRLEAGLADYAVKGS